MGRVRREKLKRREAFKASFRPAQPAYKMYGPAVLVVLGIALLSLWGLGAYRYSRFELSQNVHVQPEFHLWAIVVGLLLIGLGKWFGRRSP